MRATLSGLAPSLWLVGQQGRDPLTLPSDALADMAERRAFLLQEGDSLTARFGTLSPELDAETRLLVPPGPRV